MSKIKTEFRGNNILVLSSGNYNELYAEVDRLVGKDYTVLGFDLGWGGFVLQLPNSSKVSEK